jgi:heterodisulfide reductase subunit C
MSEEVIVNSPPSAGPVKHEDLAILNQVVMLTPGDSHLEMCIQCGTCGGSCPSASAMDHTPRAIFAMLRAGMRDEVLSSNTPCTVRCPQDIHITDVMYTLKNMALKANMVQDSTASDFSRTFIRYVENYGRSFEIGLAGIQNMTHLKLATRLPNLAPMALGMLTKKGMSPFPPKRIKGMDGLKKILKRAKEMEAA